VRGRSICDDLGVERQPVQSGALASVGYDLEAEALEIEFRSGRVYRYEQVPPSVHDWLLRAPNKGIFVTRQIVGRYPERSLPDGPGATAPGSAAASSGAAAAAAEGAAAGGNRTLGLDLESALRASLARLEGSKGTLGE
jgi:hypothetical protein